eukprot:SAG11_NODE_343_length_10455_cov_7.072036_4_plen_168_part_00
MCDVLRSPFTGTCREGTFPQRIGAQRSVCSRAEWKLADLSEGHTHELAGNLDMRRGRGLHPICHAEHFWQSPATCRQPVGIFAVIVHEGGAVRSKRGSSACEASHRCRHCYICRRAKHRRPSSLQVLSIYSYPYMPCLLPTRLQTHLHLMWSNLGGNNEWLKLKGVL